uniref:Uncharacterized protein n=1 Tax=Lotharella globosa TaxID=91324 RepID=A0A6V3KKJ2_9EUKA|mmetsp:Transcript_20048/g.38690  ORF Transcript_20048/g.38690 Transcript_20048/m.38690 type:complete len:101 (+) Transcript_20048:265-567(+)
MSSCIPQIPAGSFNMVERPRSINTVPFLGNVWRAVIRSGEIWKMGSPSTEWGISHASESGHNSYIEVFFDMCHFLFFFKKKMKKKTNQRSTKRVKREKGG